MKEKQTLHVYNPPRMNVMFIKVESRFAASTEEQATHEDYEAIDLFE